MSNHRDCGRERAVPQGLGDALVGKRRTAMVGARQNTTKTRKLAAVRETLERAGRNIAGEAGIL